MPIPKSTQLQVFFSLPNSSPDIVEQQVTSVLEGTFSQLPRLKKITSSSGYHTGSITLLFDQKANMQYKQFEVAALIRRVYEQLPAGCSYPLISQTSEKRSEAPFLIYTINAPQQPFQIKKETETIFRKALAAIPGISQVNISGSENIQLTIRYNINQCRALGLNPSQISSSIKAYTITTYPGSIITDNGEQFFLHLPPAIQNLQDVEQLLLLTKSGQLVRLNQVAQIFLEEQEAQSYFRINGNNSVNLTITGREGANKIVLANQVKTIVNTIVPFLPKGYKASLAHDDTQFLEKEMHKNYRRTAFSAAILFFFILLSYRSWRYLLVLFSSLLVNLSFAAILAYLSGVVIHLYTIAGLAISMGIMIDNAIVMLDYYHQYRNRSVFLALLGATLTTIAALCLVFFLPEEEQNNLNDFALIIVLALTSSLLTALWFTPGLYDLLFKHKSVQKPFSVYHRLKAQKRVNQINAYYRFIKFISRYRKTFVGLLILLFGIPVFLLPAKWEGNQWYQQWYNTILGSALYQENIRPYAEKWLGGTLRMFVQNVYDKSGYRSPEKTKLYVNAGLSYGNTIEQMNAILSDFEKYLSTIEGIDTYITRIYSGQSGTIEINFKDGYDSSSLPHQLKSHLIVRSLDWGGVEWNIYGIGQGFSNAGAEGIPTFRVTMKGYNYDELENQTNRLAEKLLKHKRIQKINTDERMEYTEKPSKEYILQIDKNRMALLGTNQYELLNALTVLSKPVSTQQYLTLNNQYYPVMLKEENAEEFSSNRLLSESLLLDTARKIQLKTIGQLALASTANTIFKEDRQYIRILSFEYMGSEQFGSMYLENVLNEMKLEMPIGYSASRSSWAWDWGKTKRQYSLLLLLILGNFFICSILFENLKKPLYIIIMIPVSFIGLFLTFSVSETYFDQGGYAAFVLLGGLVVNAAIFIVNDLNNLKKHRPHASYNKLIIKASSNRARTILLTTISTCCGLIPFLIEGQNEIFWFSLAAGTMGGLLFSLFAVFIALPTLLWVKKARQGD